MNVEIQERLMDARQVAEVLAVSERWVRDHTTRRLPRIPAVKLGTLIRYKPSEVRAFMAKLSTDSGSR